MTLIWSSLRFFLSDILLRTMCLSVSTSLRRISTANISTRSPCPPNSPKPQKPLTKRSLIGALTLTMCSPRKPTMFFPPTDPTYDHTIDLKPSFVPKIAKVYPLNPKEQEACKAFIDKHLKTGRIVPSKSPQAAPFFFVAKTDGSLRPCQDY